MTPDDTGHKGALMPSVTMNSSIQESSKNLVMADVDIIMKIRAYRRTCTGTVRLGRIVEWIVGGQTPRA